MSMVMPITKKVILVIVAMEIVQQTATAVIFNVQIAKLLVQ
jgi:hypothetical protein